MKAWSTWGRGVCGYVSGKEWCRERRSERTACNAHVIKAYKPFVPKVAN